MARKGTGLCNEESCIGAKTVRHTRDLIVLHHLDNPQAMHVKQPHYSGVQVEAEWVGP